jgi:hypothetical protein
MLRSVIEIPDELQARLQPKLDAENTTIEQKMLQLLESYASEASFEDQLKVARDVMNRYKGALSKLAR